MDRFQLLPERDAQLLIQTVEPFESRMHRPLPLRQRLRNREPHLHPDLVAQDKPSETPQFGAARAADENSFEPQVCSDPIRVYIWAAD